MPGQVIDTPTAEEFMRETLDKVSMSDLGAIARDLERKSAGFRTRLAHGAAATAAPSDVRAVLRSVFAARRSADAIIETVGADRLAAEFDRLLHGTDALPARAERLHDVLGAFPGVAFELPSELLHFTYPDDYWLWTRWMWDARTETGALALVTVEEFDFDASGFGDTYLKVGEATAFVSETGRAAGFTTMGEGLFGVDVFLACVYAVYMYTVLRLRMTQEFNRIVPELPDLVRRLLGVYRGEV
jgi:hypothetical protein